MMFNKLILLLVLHLLLHHLSALAQTDPVPDTPITYDTIIIEKAPLVITQKVYFKEEPQNLNRFFISAGIGLNRFFAAYDEPDHNSQAYTRTFHSRPVSLRFGYQTRTLTFETGISISRPQHQTDLRLNIMKVDTSYHVVMDTIDVYYVIKGEDTIPEYVSGPRQVTQKDTSYQLAEGSYISRYPIMQIPMIVSFPIRHRRFTFSPQLGIISSLIGQRTILRANGGLYESIGQDNRFISFATWTGIAIGQDMKNNVQLIAEMHYTNTIYNSSSPTSLFYRHTMGINLLLRKFIP